MTRLIAIPNDLLAAHGCGVAASKLSKLNKAKVSGKLPGDLVKRFSA